MSQEWHLTCWSGKAVDCDARQKFAKMLFNTIQQTKRFLKILFGFTLVALGTAMILTPGPGWLTIVFGLGILAAEFVWAKKLLDRLKEQGIRLRETVLARQRIGRA